MSDPTDAGSRGNAARQRPKSNGPELVNLIYNELPRCDSIGDETTRRMLEVITRFLSFVERGWHVEGLDQVTAHHVEEFVRAPLGGGTATKRPSIATSHLRRSAVRLLFRVLRKLDIVTHDPTLDVVLPPRSSLHARPLTDDEVTICRSYSLRTLTETRQPAAWALAEATARSSEIPRIRFADLDLDRARVWISGSTKTDARFGSLTAWGVSQLRRHQEHLRAQAQDNWPVVFAGREPTRSGQASSCTAISGTLTRAGLGAEPDLRPVSVAAWAGIAILRESGRIEETARRLGVRSLDRTARLLGWDWASHDATAV